MGENEQWGIKKGQWEDADGVGREGERWMGDEDMC